MKVKSCGYSVQRKPYHVRKTLVHYLVRLQMEQFADVRLDGTAFRIAPGDLLLGSPGQQYELNIDVTDPSQPSADYFLFMEANDPGTDHWWERNRDAVMFHVGFDETLISIWKLISSEKRRTRDASAAILSQLSQALLLHLERLLTFDPKASAYERSVTNQIKRYIETNAVEPLTLPKICASAGLSVSRASELFKKAFDQSIIDYLIEVRLSMAKDRIFAGGFTLEGIAYSCGFKTYSHFNRMFRARYGYSPSDYRKRLNSPRA